MQIGVVYPQTEYGSDPAAIRDYAQTAEDLGYSHILAYDHVVGANPERPGGWKGPYTFEHPFQEPFVLFSFMAGVTQAIGFTTGIIILPQRQTALVAKQAATLDVLSGGRLRVGVGLGWNQVEYQSLGQDFHSCGSARRTGEPAAPVVDSVAGELLRALGHDPDTDQSTAVQRPIPSGSADTPSLRCGAPPAWATVDAQLPHARRRQASGNPVSRWKKPADRTALESRAHSIWGRRSGFRELMVHNWQALKPTCPSTRWGSDSATRPNTCRQSPGLLQRSSRPAGR
jgi:hypothetical protein